MLEDIAYLIYLLQVLDASWYMPDEQRNPIQEYQVTNWMCCTSIWTMLCHAWLLYVFNRCLMLNLILNDILCSGCSHSWCSFLWRGWNSRSNYKCEIIFLSFWSILIAFLCIFASPSQALWIDRHVWYSVRWIPYSFVHPFILSSATAWIAISFCR